MKMRYFAAAAACAFSFAAMAQTEVNRYGTDVTSDMALIYAGGDQRPEWTVDEIAPYVTHTHADGRRSWLFDGFMFLEFSSGSTGVGFCNGTSGKKATRADWEWLLDKTFDPHSKLAALDSAITLAKAELVQPPMRHKVVLCVPAPYIGQKDWGKLDGVALDFGKPEDREKAVKWYVSKLIERFLKADYKNFDFEVTYWIEESLYSSGKMILAINDFIRSKGLRTYWIPYYKDNEQYKFNWKDVYRFDMAYQQPNYFFEREIPYSQLVQSCDESKKYGLGLELEFETQGKSVLMHSHPDSYYDRLVDYLDVFEARGVFDESAVAYYSGTKGFLDMSRSTDPRDRSIMDRIARHVERRQLKKAAEAAGYKAPDLKEIKKKFPVNEIRDLALIYQGGKQRIDWTQEQFEPYVAHTFADGSKDWLFDGYLFLEFSDGVDRNFAPGYQPKDGRRSEWELYLGRLFEKGKSLDALDKCIEANKKEIGDPGFKHKIVLTLLTPMHGQKDWGKLDGKALDFDNADDRLAACRWFIDELVKRFAKKGYRNLELQGIYWVDEDMCRTPDFTRQIAPYIHEKGLQFVWIPYFRARGFNHWREHGFDIAYHQPNHFFDKNLPDVRLDVACDVALDTGMAMEFECDSKALYGIEDSSYDRMNAYMDAFERRGVYATSAIAYYTGSKALIDLFNNKCPENQAITDRFARFIVERRGNSALVPAKD